MAPGLWRWKDDEPGTPAEIIHCTYVRLMLQDRRWQRLLWLRLFTAWCVVAGLFLSLAMTMWMGTTIKRRTGKAMWRQFAEQQAVMWRYGIQARWYYVFELFDDSQRARAGDFIHRFETKYALYTLLRLRFAGQQPVSVTNKLRYFEQCRKFDLPTPPILAVARQGQLIMQDGRQRLPEQDLFVKLLDGSGGRGASRWLFRDGTFHSPDSGKALSADALMQRLARASKRQGFIVQPCLTTCQALQDLALGALITVRILSIRNEEGEIEITDAALRMPSVKAPVDNVGAGGIAAHVDIATGRLSKATDLGIRRDTQWHTHHPATGAAIEGRVLPFWQQSLDLALRAHRDASRDRALIGWDIGLTDDGPILIEANKTPHIDGIQRRSRQPLGSTRFGAAFAHLLTLPADGQRLHDIVTRKAV